MQGIVSLLPCPFYEQVNEIWKELEKEAGIVGIKATPYPHFSWQIANNYDLNKLEIILKEIAKNSKPFLVHTNGLGFFTGERPVIYIPVVKTREMMSFHLKVFKLTEGLANEASKLYDPKSWVPHISLAYEDLNENNICKAVKILLSQNFNWVFKIDNLSVICENEGKTGTLKFKFPFMKE
jgi:2'-5' RNA ligase